MVSLTANTVAELRQRGAFLLLSALPNARELPGAKGYDSDWLRAGLTERGITPCIPQRSNRKVQYNYDKTFYRQRHKIENLSGRITLLDREIAT